MIVFQGEPDFTCVLSVDLKTQNTGRGNAWFSASSERNKLLRQLSDHVRDPFTRPVAVIYTRILGPKQVRWDNDNLAMACKQLQDTLVELGWFYDDTPDWLTLIGYRHADFRGDFPAVMVSVWEGIE